MENFANARKLMSQGAKIEKLESLRGFAAIYVLLSHTFSHVLHFQGQWYGQPFRFAQEAVLIFFLLSGFVIFYSWERTSPPKNFLLFFAKRLHRIYPTFLLALLLTYLVACLNAGNLLHLNLSNLLENLVLLQGFDGDIGWQALPFMGNGPLWSLAYEWWFYLLFYPIYRFVPIVAQKWIVLDLALIGIGGNILLPNLAFQILGSLPIWWCGVEFAREYIQTGDMTWDKQKATVGMITLSGLAYGLVTWDWYLSGQVVNIITYPLCKIRHIIACFVMIALFFAWKRIAFLGYDWTLRPFRLFAGTSYAIYAFHFPIMTMNLSSKKIPLLVAIGIQLLAVLSLAYLAENILQRFLPWKRAKRLAINLAPLDAKGL